MKRLLPISLLLIMLLAVVLAYWAGRRHPFTHAAPSVETPAKAAVLYWYDPMVPAQHFDKPGLSPMGMEMVPRFADADTTAAKDAVKIDAATAQNLAVRTARVERRTLDSVVQVPGTITWDVRQAVTVSARVDAIISRLDVRAPYTVVAAHAPLAELLAPQWSSAIAESEALQHAQSTDAKALRDAARQRLQVLGLSATDIRALGHGQPAITLHAPQAGVVTSLDVRDGQRVSAGQTLMTINGLSTVWVEAALPQAVAGTVHANTPVSIRVDALPDRVFAGKVETLLPDIDTVTRTQRARIVLANPDGALSPGMFAHVELTPVSSEAALVVPDEALIAVGRRTRVIIVDGDGRFRPVAVRTGRTAGGYTQVLSGLDGHEKVVTSAQFLIDSEASLSGALERMGDDGIEPPSSTSASTPAMPMGDVR
jgi:Cu(I)/Ag(I) efflux system membrane fusion protein